MDMILVNGYAIFSNYTWGSSIREFLNPFYGFFKVQARILILTMTCIVAFHLGNSQDVIIKNDNKSIEAKVVEIADNYVKYRLWAERGDGPLYSLKREEINLIIYQNGRREAFKGNEIKNQTNSSVDSTVRPPKDVLSKFSPADFQQLNDKINELKSDETGNTIQLNVQFDYTSLIVNDKLKGSSEEDYVKQQVKEKGESWLEKWKSNKVVEYEPTFVLDFNIDGKKKNKKYFDLITLDNTTRHNYTLIVVVKKILIDDLIAATSAIWFQGYIVETDNPGKIISKFPIVNRKKDQDSYLVQSSGLQWGILDRRLIACYGALGSVLSLDIRKHLSER
jgi:hypothetical protein